MWQKARTIGLFIGLLLYAISSRAQLRFSVWSDNYFEVTSYLGHTTSDRFNTFQFDLHGQYIHHPNWSLAVRLLAPIQTIAGGPNRSGKPLPPDKISFQWTSDNNNPAFRLDAIGASRSPIILQNSNDVLLVERSKQPISSQGSHYSQYHLYGAVTVAPGKYLDDYLSPNQYTYLKYRIPLLFTLYDELRNVIGTQQVNYEMQFPPSLTDGHLVDAEPDYKLEVSAESPNLQFHTRNDYTQGVSLQIPNAVQVNSITDFELHIKSVDSEILREGGGALPLSILSVQLSPASGVVALKSSPTVVLSTREQVAVASTSKDKTQTQYFNAEYKASLSRDQVLQAKPGDYSVSLLYLLMPR
ncbi:hypothetical protein BC792_13222 [Sphingobacterium allocomposti]|uniref:Uncharacterized protein n=1 Tax=Sphingobacterium allocomposti TaxID=415956 RepID=A0A5S5CZB3_9SPHI|nr:hypothetical protein [Sphingobacterium composti Yoo et al. 2007 non Ten et al. 2007]TYP88206.1 hypothetical protein BC792_13222 [Sphingobacterium composti Yoo et al. 2007 non Ten et al. 2007]